METSIHKEAAKYASLFADLPQEKWGGTHLYQWEGFWFMPSLLDAAISAQSHFNAREDDILLASSMKTGTTWLKALIPCIVNRDSEAANGDPLLTNHPNTLIPSLEVQLYRNKATPDLSALPSPRLFRTHIPYGMLSDSIKKSGCKIVYITRDPKDTFVSLWHFFNAMTPPENQPLPLDETFDSFCQGVHPYGPFHDHVLGYWKESLKRPEKILFLKYEEMRRDPKGQVKKLASFLNKPFDNEEEVEKILWRCSFERLKELEVNKKGADPSTGIAYRAYFRCGTVGDWKNNLSMEMKERINKIMGMKLAGSGLRIGDEQNMNS